MLASVRALLRRGHRVLEQEKSLLGDDSTVQRPKDNKRSVKWVDGLRGLASFSVLTSHICRAFDYWSFMPSDAPDWSMRFIQWPYVRLWPQGRTGVAIFALLTGFVCGIKAIKQIRDGDPSAARDTLGKAAFKRPARLMLPAFLSTMVAFIVCQLGLFYIDSIIEVEWLPLATVQRLPFFEDLNRLQKNLRSTWTDGVNEYDDHQWALLPLLKSSLFMYASLAAVAGLRFRYRMMTYVLFFAYYWQNPQHDTETFFCLGYYGLFLSDLSQYKPFQDYVQSRSWVRRVISVTLIIVGFYIASYPADYADWKPWCKILQPLQWLFPDGIDHVWMPKRYTAIGLILGVGGIVLNNSARIFLCTRPLQFMGKHSFAVYLTHGTLLKTILMWMLYGFGGRLDPNLKDKDGKVERIPRPGTGTIAVWVPIWLVVVYIVSWAWSTYVDPWCDKVCGWLAKKTAQPS